MYADGCLLGERDTSGRGRTILTVNAGSRTMWIDDRRTKTLLTGVRGYSRRARNIPRFDKSILFEWNMRLDFGGGLEAEPCLSWRVNDK